MYFPLQAQLVNDSTALIQPDSTVAVRLNQLDSIRQETESDYASFKNKYDSVNQSASAKQAKLQSKIDSLTTLNLPTLDLSYKLDSTKEARTSKLKELESKWENKKSKHTSAITDLNLPLAVLSLQLRTFYNCLLVLSLYRYTRYVYTVVYSF